MCSWAYMAEHCAATPALHSGGRGRKFKSSHPDQLFPNQINSLQRPQVGHCLFAGPVCGSFAGVLREFFPDAPISHSKDSCRSLFAEHVSCVKQSNQIRRRVVRCDTRRLVAQQILPIFEADSPSFSDCPVSSDRKKTPTPKRRGPDFACRPD